MRKWKGHHARVSVEREDRRAVQLNEEIVHILIAGVNLKICATPILVRQLVNGRSWKITREHSRERHRIEKIKFRKQI
jgi:hypothetical protein